MTADLPGGALTPAMAALLGDGGAKLRAQEPTHNAGNQATGGIWRVEGPAGRAVLKIATADGGGDAAWATSERGDHWNYWRREPLAYQTGFVHRVYAEAGLGAPGLLAAVEPRPGTVALWLEDVAGLPGPRWPVARLADLAERLGRAQAGWAGRDPPYPWLSRRWLRQYVTRQPIGEPVAWDHPLASAAWPPELRAGLRRLWLRRAELLDLAEALPQTTCHLDVWPMNLVARGGPGDEVVLLDWAFAGAGAVGEDVGNLIPDSVADALVDPALLPEIDQAVTAAYLAGLRMGGYRGRDAQVRRAIAVTGAAKYCWLAPLMLQRLAGGAISRFYDRRGTEELLRGRAGMLRLVADWGRSALDGPAKTVSRLASTRSASPSRSQLHSTTARSVWCRGCAVRSPRPSSRKAKGRPSRSASAGPRHRPSASRSSAAARGASPAARARRPCAASRSKRRASTSSGWTASR